MIFSTPVFLFLFLPVVLACYWLTPQRAKNLVLLTASLLFYAWGEQFFVVVMLASILLNYLFGHWLDRARDRPRLQLILAFGVVANLALLGTYKYANFLVDNLNHMMPMVGLPEMAVAPIHLPIGISFFTFQAISYLVDTYRREAPPRPGLVQLALYIALFPQLIAGPIVRYRTMAHALMARRTDLSDLAEGVSRFSLGLGKKVLLANPLGSIADPVFALPAEQLTTPVAWLGIICYTLQIYFDFSGYSDMAIGLGRLFGFHFPENFNAPYIARSLREFWQRWHISLSSWFRDYVYIPLGGNRLGTWRTHLNLLAVFLLCGLWHGASWNFVVWGLLHGSFLVLERGHWGRILQRLWRPLQHLYAVLVVMLAWVFFRLETLADALDYIATLFGQSQVVLTPVVPTDSVHHYLSHELWLVLLVALAAATPLRSIWSRWQPRHPLWSGGRALLSGGALGLILLMSSLSVAAGTYNPFIYFRF